MGAPRPITPADREFWVELHPREHTFTGPGEVEPCAALVTDTDAPGMSGVKVVRVPWQLDPDEIAALADGGTLWFSSWGHLPIHSIEVAPKGE